MRTTPLNWTKNLRAAASICAAPRHELQHHLLAVAASKPLAIMILDPVEVRRNLRRLIGE
jgi:hypothetical protein